MSSDTESEISIEQIFQILYKRLGLIILFTIVAGVASGLVSWYLMDNVYQASSTVIVSNQKDKDAATQAQLTVSDYNLNVQLVNSYSVLCKTNRVLDQVIATLALPMTTSQLSEMITVDSVKSTEIIHISVKDKDPLLAQNICNSLTTIFQTEVQAIMQMDNVQIIDKAPLPFIPVEPNRTRNVLIGLALGMAFGVGLAFVLELLDRTVKTEEQIQDILGVPVLGIIPTISNKK